MSKARFLDRVRANLDGLAPWRLRPEVAWLLGFAISLALLQSLRPTTFGPLHTLAWAAGSVLVSVTGTGLVYELIVSEGFEARVFKLLQHAVAERSSSEHLLSQAAEARIVLRLLRTRDYQEWRSVRGAHLVVISKRFRVRLEKEARIVFRTKEAEAVDATTHRGVLMSWSFSPGNSAWPKDVPMMKVTRLEVGGEDITSSLQRPSLSPRRGEVSFRVPRRHQRECVVRVDCLSFVEAPVGPANSLDFEIYLPRAAAVWLLFDPTPAGLDAAWIEGTPTNGIPLAYGLGGSGPVEALVTPAKVGSYVTFHASRHSG